MRTYYRGPDVVVTTAVFADRACAKPYAIRDLQRAHIAHTRHALWRLRPQTWELWATYRGAEVLLYSSTDARVFHQVSRALRRAIEDTRPPATWRDLAAA